MAGRKFTTPVVLPADPTDALEATTKQYVDAHTSDGTAAHAASAISYAGNAGLSATDVEAALDELDNEKQPLDADLTAWAGKTAPSGSAVGTSDTQTLTNKRISPRTGTVTSSATPTINTDNVDFFSITALTTAITSMTTNLTGTPTEGQLLWIAITGTASRAITWGASFESSGGAILPTTTSGTTRLDVGFVWNTVSSKWRCVAVA